MGEIVCTEYQKCLRRKVKYTFWLYMNFEPSLSRSGIGLPPDIYPLEREGTTEQLCVSVRKYCSLWSRRWSRESVGSTQTRVCVIIGATVSTYPSTGLEFPEVVHGVPALV